MFKLLGLMLLSLMIVSQLTSRATVSSQAVDDWQFNFEIYPENPVVPMGESGDWDYGGNIGHSIVDHEGIYYLIYTGISNRGTNPSMRLGYATSTDGYTWEKSPDNPIVSSMDMFAHAHLVAATVADGQWLLIFSESTDRIFPTSKVYRATADALTGPWTVELIMDTSAHQWDRNIMPEHIVKRDDGYALYYTGTTNRYQAYQLGLATSPDGTDWTFFNDPSTESNSDPILPVGSEGTWDALGVSASNPVQTENGWELFYTGYSIAPTTNLLTADPRNEVWLGYAYSADGIHWEKYAANPVINTQLAVGPFLSTLIIDDTYFIYYDFRVEVGGSGIGLITGKIER